MSARAATSAARADAVAAVAGGEGSRVGRVEVVHDQAVHATEPSQAEDHQLGLGARADDAEDGLLPGIGGQDVGADAAARPVRQAVIVAESSSASNSPSWPLCRQMTPRRAGRAPGNLALTFTV